MKKYITLAITALTIFSACTSESEAIRSEAVVDNGEQTPLEFSTYMGRYATRAQQTGIMTNSELETTGFGVFAYYSDNTDYSSSLQPNFMWNQKVTYSSSVWSYSPVKYWPNEFGTNAQSTGTDKLSFFAYAPYVKTTDTNGTTLSSESSITDGGITGISANNATGDPKIKYISALNPANSVDLLWAVNNTYVSDETAYTGPTESAWKAAQSGLPYLNMDKMPIDQKINFTFKHALTRLGITVQGMFDQVNDKSGTSDKSDDNVKSKSIIMIESVTLRGPYRWRGELNLNNTTANTANWEEQQTNRAAAEASAQSTLTLVNNSPSTGQHKVATSLAYTNGNKASQYTTGDGVTKERKDIFTGDVIDAENAKRQYYMFVPQQASGATTVTIKYHVITDDERLYGGKIDITNEITKTLEEGALNFSCGKANELNLVLGLTTVDVRATVTDWPSATDENIDLPVNSSTPATP